MFFHFLYDNEVVNKETSEQATFQNIKHVDDNGSEFWYARELQEVLEYKKWENFCKVIDKAKKACKGSGNAVSLHFPDVRKMLPIGNETYREEETKI